VTTASSRAVAAALADASAVSILSHVRPDADTIGSALGLALALRARGVTASVAFSGPDPLPVPLGRLPGADLIVDERSLVPAPLAVAVDAATIERLGDLQPVFEASAMTVCIDHHASNGGFADLDLIDPESDCTAVLVLEVLDALGAELTPDIATCLYAGLLTDTGSFKWARPESFRVAARLTEAGVDTATWSRILLDTHPFAWQSMLAQVLATSRLDRQARGGAGLVWAVVTAAQLDGLSWEESESVVDVVRTAAEAEVAAVFKESTPGHWTVSLRSKGTDLVPVARALGGGGHARAAGYSDSGTADEVVGRLREEL